MKFHALYRVELGRLLSSRVTWLVVALTVLSPLAGFSLVTPTIGDSMSALYLANPMLTGGLAGTVLFSILILTSLEVAHRSGIASMTDAIASPMSMCAGRLLAVLSVAVLTGLFAGLVYLPYTAWKLDIVFSLLDYILSVALFFLSGPVMGTLAAAALWQLLQRLDVSLLAVLGGLIASRSEWFRERFLAQWSVPQVPTLSDAFGSAIVWRTASYSRAVWLCFLVGAWLLTLLCVRQYGKGVLGSLAHHARRAWIPVLALLLFCGGGLLWYGQPFIDHSPANWEELIGTEADRSNEALSLHSATLCVSIESYLLGTLSGTGTYQLENTSGQPQTLYLNLNSGYTVHSVTANGREIPFEDLCNDFIATRELCCTLPADEVIELKVTYGGLPRIWNAMEYALGDSYVSGSGLSLASHHLAPTLTGSALPAEDAAVSLDITLKDTLTPVTTGRLTKISSNDDGTTSWRIEDSGTDRLWLFAGDYISTDLDAGNGTTIPFYYSKKYQTRLEDGALGLMERAIQYCTTHYGPRSDRGAAFKILQTKAFEFGGFAVGNISGMGESYFSDENLSDPDKGPGSAEVLAHEIIHQWWGLGAMLMDMEDGAWNDEGITVYTTYRLMCQIMGEEYAREQYVEKWEATMKSLADSFYHRHPEYADRLPERYRSNLLSISDGANWYDGNALMIYRAAQIIGQDKVDEIWARLYTEGGSEMPPYITLGDFLTACGLEKGEVGRE